MGQPDPIVRIPALSNGQRSPNGYEVGQVSVGHGRRYGRVHRSLFEKKDGRRQGAPEPAAVKDDDSVKIRDNKAEADGRIRTLELMAYA